jgi:hypothetical protein
LEFFERLCQFLFEQLDICQRLRLHLQFKHAFVGRNLCQSLLELLPQNRQVLCREDRILR